MFPVLFGRVAKAVVAVVYLLRDQFTTNASAPLTTPRTCEPGPGTLTVTDTNSRISIAGSVLSVSGVTAANDGIVSPSTSARAAGRALLFSLPSITTITSNVRLGWADAGLSDTSLAIGVDYNGAGTSVRIKNGASVVDTLTVSGAQHDWAMVMRATGGFVFLRTGGGTGAYTLLWVYNAGTAAEFAKWLITNTTVTFTMDDLRITDLGGSFATDNGIATDRKTTVADSATFVVAAQSNLCEWTINYTGLPCNVWPRYVDSSNRWEVNAQADGTLNFVEDVAGSRTSRGSVVSTFAATNTYRIVITMDVNVYKIYVNNVLKISYTDPSSFHVAATGGFVNTVGGGVSEIVSWPRTVTLPNV